MAALVAERRSQICLGLDPDPLRLPPPRGSEANGGLREALVAHCVDSIERAGSACVAAKLQLACFERLGPEGWRALYEVAAAAREAGLLVIADGKRGDVPITAAAYGQALFGETETPWGPVPGLRADAATVNPLLGRDALRPLIDAARKSGSGLFVLVRTSNSGAAELQDEPRELPLHERVAAIVAEEAAGLAGEGPMSGLGAVVAATAPTLIAVLRELMPRAIFLMPGVGAQGGRAGELGAAFAPAPAAALVSASRGIVEAPDPAAAAEALRREVWEASGAKA